MDKDINNNRLHHQQRFFLEDYTSHFGIDLKDMNNRRDQSLNSDLDISRVQNSSMIKEINNSLGCQSASKNTHIMKQKSQSCDFKQVMDNSSVNNQLIENNLDATIALATQNDRTITAQSVHNIPKESESLKEGFNEKLRVETKTKNKESQYKAADKKRTTKQVNESQRKSVNFQNLQNVSLIPRVMKKINYFYQMFTNSGRLKFLESSTQIRMQISDLSETNSKNVSILAILLKLMLKSLEFYENKLMKNMPLIETYGNVNFCIIMFYLLYNLLFFYFLSLVIVFNMPSDYLNYIYYLTGSLWIVQSFLYINTKIYRPFKAEYQRKKIFISYINRRSFFDILPMIIIFYLPSLDNSSLYIKLILFVKFKNIIADIHEVQKQLCMMFRNYFFIKLINLILQLFLIAHILSICWYLLGIFEVNYLNSQTTWFNDGISSDLIWWKLYLASFYWCLTLMATGSNIATTEAQTTFTCLAMFFTAIVYGYLINVVGMILSELDKSNETQNRDINLVNEYMRIKNISRTLKTKVNMDIEYYYSNSQTDQLQEEVQVLTKLPQELNDQLQMEYSEQIISKIGLITQNFSRELQDNLGYIFKEESYFPNQTIYNEKDVQSPSLIFILQGEVALYQQIANDGSYQKVYKVLKKGDTFGQLSFISDQARESTAKTTKYTRVIKISRKDFLSLMTVESKDYEVFTQLKDYILLYDNFKEINLQCSFCESYSHQEDTCTSLHFSRDQAFFKSSFEQRYQQVRVNQQRKRIKYSTLAKQFQLREEINTFLEQQHLDSINSQFFNQLEEEDEYSCGDGKKEDQINTQIEVQTQQQQQPQPQEVILQRKKSILLENSVQRRPSLIKTIQFPTNNSIQLASEQIQQLAPPSNINIPPIIERINSGAVIRQSSFFEKQVSEKINYEVEKKNSILSYHQSNQQNEVLVLQTKGINPWQFESIKNYIHYFPKGNSRYFFNKANKYIRKNLSQLIYHKKNK